MLLVSQEERKVNRKKNITFKNMGKQEIFKPETVIY